MPFVNNDGDQQPGDDRTEFERFEDLTRRLVRVPKSEADRERELARYEVLRVREARRLAEST